MSLATQHDSADESPGLLLWQVTNRWQAAQRATGPGEELASHTLLFLTLLPKPSSLDFEDWQAILLLTKYLHPARFQPADSSGVRLAPRQA